MAQWGSGGGADLRWRGPGGILLGRTRSTGDTSVLGAPRPLSLKGCGIVEFETAEEAANAINTLNDTELDGRMIFIREDREDRDLIASTRGMAAPMGSGGFNSPLPRMAPSNFPAKRSRLVAPSGGFGGGGYSQGGSDGTITLGRRVYVSNLTYETTWKDLKDHFRAMGNVLYADVLTDPATGKSKGCGIVEFEHASQALAAIAHLSNTNLGGRLILVREDREDKAMTPGWLPRQPPTAGFRAGGAAPSSGFRNTPAVRSAVVGGNNGGAVGGRQVVVQNLPFSVNWKNLKDFAFKAGNVVRADIMVDDAGNSKGFGTVLYETSQDAQKAIATLDGCDMGGRAVRVKLV
eukprot:jgi/Mesvir1/18510/Mv14018-RA.1